MTNAVVHKHYQQYSLYGDSVKYS